MSTEPDQWWGTYSFEVGEGGQWNLGPWQFAVQRHPREWFVAYKNIEMEQNDREWSFTAIGPELPVSEFPDVAR